MRRLKNMSAMKTSSRTSAEFVLFCYSLFVLVLLDWETIPGLIGVQAYSGSNAPLVSRYISSSLRHATLMSVVEEQQHDSSEFSSRDFTPPQSPSSSSYPTHLDVTAESVIELYESADSGAGQEIPMRGSTPSRGSNGNRGRSTFSAPITNGNSKNRRTATSTSTNPSDDPVFLRKRTANLLALSPESLTSSDDGAVASQKTSSNFKPDKKTFHFLMDAWAFSGEPDADVQAEALLKQMEALQLDPDVRSYTKVMNAISRSGKVDAGSRAEALLEQMAFLSSTRGLSLQPNTFSYTALVEAYANSGTPQSAYQAEMWCKQMWNKYKDGDATVVPTSRAFHAVITAYGKSGQPDAGPKAQAVFDLLEEVWRETRLDECKPTAFNYNALITAWANCPEPGSAQRANRVLERMEELYQAGEVDLKPTTVTFNAVIDAYAKAAGNDNTDNNSNIDFSTSASSTGAAAECAEELLRRMEALHRSGKNADARPNVRSFNSVLNVWAKSGHDEGADRAQEILELMENMYKQGNDEVQPDVHSFCTVINAWARSPAPNKVDRAWNLFREMKSLYSMGNHDHLKPNVVAYNAVLNACAFCNSNAGLSESSHAMEMAHAILKEMEQSTTVQPDQVTYGTFLKVCANQLPDCSTRHQIVEMIFHKCKRDGQVGNLVLQQIRAMVPDDLYVRLMGRSPSVELRTEDLPREWWCNVVEGKWRRKRSAWN